jgi:hypothetical protein
MVGEVSVDMTRVAMPSLYSVVRAGLLFINIMVLLYINSVTHQIVVPNQTYSMQVTGHTAAST